MPLKFKKSYSISLLFIQRYWQQSLNNFYVVYGGEVFYEFHVVAVGYYVVLAHYILYEIFGRTFKDHFDTWQLGGRGCPTGFFPGFRSLSCAPHGVDNQFAIHLSQPDDGNFAGFDFGYIEQAFAE